MSGTVRRGPLPGGGALGSPRADAAFERFVRHRDAVAGAPEAIRSRRVDWTPVGFPEDPTPGDVDVVEALHAVVSAEAKRLAHQADPAAVALEALVDALWAWSACLSSAQEAAVAALRAAEEAEEDRALARLSAGLGSHHRLDDAQRRLARAWSAAREAEKEFHAGETRLIRALDEASAAGLGSG